MGGPCSCPCQNRGHFQGFYPFTVGNGNIFTEKPSSTCPIPQPGRYLQVSRSVVKLLVSVDRGSVRLSIVSNASFILANFQRIFKVKTTQKKKKNFTCRPKHHFNPLTHNNVTYFLKRTFGSFFID